MKALKSNFIICIFWTLMAFIAGIITNTLLNALLYALLIFIHTFCMWGLFYIQYKRGELCH